MNTRLNIDNPFRDGNASASAFGWQFQVDAAIFLFLYYIDEVDEIVVEGKYQDIELLCKNSRHIYAQAKSITPLPVKYSQNSPVSSFSGAYVQRATLSPYSSINPS